MSLNKFTDINIKKQWMNVNCHNIECDNFISENIECKNLIATETIECKNIITEDLNVKINPTDTINFKTPNIGLIGDVLATDGLGNTYWTSNPSPPPTGITYNGVIPAPLGQLLKNSNGIGTTASLSNILDDGTNVNINSVNLYSNNYIKNGGSSLEYLMADGSISTVSSIGSNIYYYQFDTNITTPPPIQNGHIQFNTATPTAVVNVFISHLTNGTITDIDPFFPSIQPNNILYIQDRDDSTKFIKFTVITTSITTNSFINISVSYLSSSVGFTVFNNNHNIYFSIFSTNTIPVITLNNVGTNSIISSNVSPTFLLKGLSSSTGITVSTTATDIEITNTSPASVISLTNSGTGNTLLNSTTNPNFTTKGLIAGSGITLAATATDIYIINSSSATAYFQGFPFNPFINATTTISTGNKSYFYTVYIARPTTINGFAVYCGSGSDPIRVAIYRGYIDSSPIVNATLIGQSVSTAASSTSMPYTNNVITAVGGQNLNFVQGEYMVIGFGSQGTTNVFYSSPVNGTTGLFDQAFISSSNYVAAGFPSIIQTSTQFSSLVSKICLELY